MSSTEQQQKPELWAPVPDYPGWRKHVYNDPASPFGGRSTEYVGPAGELLSPISFQHAKRKYLKSSGAAGTPQPDASQAPAAPVGAGAGAGAGAGVTLQLPEPTHDRPSATTKREGLATPVELATMIAMLLAMVTWLVAFVAKWPEVQMTDGEIQALATPLGNILEKSKLNRQYGRYLKDGTDYTFVGYALFAYGTRLMTATRDRMERQQREAEYASTMAPAMGLGSSLNGATPLPRGPTAADAAGPAGGSQASNLAAGMGPHPAQQPVNGHGPAAAYGGLAAIARPGATLPYGGPRPATGGLAGAAQPPVPEPPQG